MAGPIATTLDNDRVAFLTVTPETQARNVYPAGTTREALDAFFAAHPDRRDELLDDRAVVWEATPENRRRAFNALRRYPVLDTLHPGLRERLQTSATYIAVPYSVAYAEEMIEAHRLLNLAADVNVDQRVTAEEWAAATQRWFLSLDTDRDGRLTQAGLPVTPLQAREGRGR